MADEAILMDLEMDDAAGFLEGEATGPEERQDEEAGETWLHKYRRAPKSELTTYGGLTSGEDMYAPIGQPPLQQQQPPLPPPQQQPALQIVTGSTHGYAVERMANMTRHRATFREGSSVAPAPSVPATVTEAKVATTPAAITATTSFSTPTAKTLGKPPAWEAYALQEESSADSSTAPSPSIPVLGVGVPPTPPGRSSRVQWETLKFGDGMVRRSWLQLLIIYTWGWIRPITSTMPGFSKLARRTSLKMGTHVVYPLVPVDILLRGMSQGLFINNPVTGLMYWAAMMQANVWVGLMAFLGLVVSSTFAWGMRLNTGFLHSGLYGFSGFLTAATMAYFNGAGDWDAMIVLPIILVSMLTVFVFAGFVTVMTVPYGVPPLGLPFTVVSLIWLLSVSDSIRLPTNAVPEKTYVRSDAPMPIFSELLGTVFRGFAVLAFDGEIHTGVIVFCGIFLGSPILALYSFISGLFGVFFNLAVAAPRPTYIITGPSTRPGSAAASVPATLPPLSPFPRRPLPPGAVPRVPTTTAPPFTTTTTTTTTIAPALAHSTAADWPGLYSGSGAVDAIYAGMISGMFWMPGAKTLLLAVFSGMVSSMIRNAVSNVFYIWGLPTLALPFCLATLPLLFNHKFLPAFRAIPIPRLTSPEDHLYRNRIVKRTLRVLRRTLSVGGMDRMRLALSNKVGARVQAAAAKVGLSAGDGGLVSRDSLARILSRLGALPSNVENWHQVGKTARPELSMWFDAADVTRRGLVEVSAVCDMVLDAIMCSRMESVARKFFRVTGHEATGYMTRGQFREAVFQAGDKLTWAEEATLFRRANALGLNGVYINLDVMLKTDLIDALLPDSGLAYEL